MRKILIFIFLFILVGFAVFIYVYRDDAVLDNLLGHKGITEGVIEYDITYPDLDSNSILLSGMPKKAFLHFKNNIISNDMSGMMGLINIAYISNLKTKQVEQRLTLFNKKYVSEISMDKLKELNNSYVSSIEEGKNVMKIAGYKCKESLVRLINGKQTKVFYTNDIGIDSANWANPYNKIHGVLMDFNMERYGVSMHLKAKSVLPQKIEDNVLSIPADSTQYKKVLFSELEKILVELNPNAN